jgi:hypothetical protein
MIRGLKWGLITLALAAFFYFAIPLDIFSDYLYGIIIIGSALITVAFTIFIFSFYPGKAKENTEVVPVNSVEEIDKTKDDGDYSGCLVGALIVGVFFGMSFLLIYREIQLEKIELANYGEMTNAIVVGGSSYSTRKADFTKLTLQFTTKSGKSRKIDHSINKNQFDNYYQSQKIPIIYSTRYPQILEILDSEEKFEKYLKMHKEVN